MKLFFLTTPTYFDYETAIIRVSLYEDDTFDTIDSETAEQLIKEEMENLNDDTITLSDEQKDAIISILKNPFSIVNAPGGTGKTSVVARISLKILEKLDFHTFVITPTHEAKKSDKRLYELV